MENDIVYFQAHTHSKYSINRLSGEGVFHKLTWPIERFILRTIMKSPKGLLKLAHKKGVSYVAVTDHNRVPAIDEGRDYLITGEEWGQRKGHSNLINLVVSVSPECGYFEGIEPESPKDFQSAAVETARQGGFVSINHPFKKDAWLWGEESYPLANALEIWNGKWCEENQKALDLWQKLLVGGSKIWCMAGNDFHVNRIFNIDFQVIAFTNTDSKQSLILKLKNGDFSITRDTGTPIVFLRKDLSYLIEKYREPIELRVVFPSHTEKRQTPSKTGVIERKENQNFVRLELWEENTPLSFSNPVFL